MKAGAKRVRKLAVAFLAAEALGGLTFWMLLLLKPGWMRLLGPPGISAQALPGLALADLPLLVIAAAAAAWGLAKGRFWASGVLFLHAGAMTYGGLATWGLVIAAGGPLWAGLLVIPSMTIPLWLACTLRPERPR